MGKSVCFGVAVVALACTPVAAGGRLVSVGYTTPSALHGLRVVTRIGALHTAEVRVANAALTAAEATKLKAEVQTQAKSMVNKVTLGGMQGAAVGAGPRNGAAAGSGVGNGPGARGAGSGTGTCDGTGPQGAGRP